MNKINRLLIFIISIACFSCNNKNGDSDDQKSDGQQAIFTLLDMKSSGFDYINRIVENESLNELTYEYFYNGAGVAIGDINNDGLPDILMGGNMFGARLFLNMGDMHFKDITEQAKLMTNGFQTGVTMADVNGDGFLDIYICRSLFNNKEERRNLLFINNKDFTFTEQAKAYGLDDPGFSNQASFFDYDGDGDLDMFLTNHRADFFNALFIIPEREWKAELARMKQNKGDQYAFFSNKLYRNNGNQSFTDVTIAAGLMTYDYTLSATIADVNQDNLPDIYVAADYATKDHLYINKGNGVFEDQIDQKLMHFSKNSMGSDIADYNNDGLPDIVTMDMVSEDNYRQKQLRGFAAYDIFKSIEEYKLGYQTEGNCLQLNTGNGTFSEVAKFAGVANTDWSWAPLFADFDNDGHKDLFVTNGYARDITDMDYIKYISPEIIRKSGGPQTAPKMKLLNSVPSVPLKNYMYRNKGNLQFSNNTDAWGLSQPSFSNGAAYADLDQDGDLDLVVNNFNQLSFLYKNESREKLPQHHFLSIRLKNAAPNTFAVGSKVWVKTNSETQYQELFNTRGFLSAVGNDLSFGLGTAAGPVQVIVQWPNGNLKILDQVKADQLLLINPADGRDSVLNNKVSSQTVLTNTGNLSLPAYVHKESGYIDFKTDALLEYAVSQMGPWVSTADVNGDGKDDFFVSGSAGEPGSLYLQTADGKFRLLQQAAFALHKNKKDAMSLFFDCDGDGDQDLFITSGFNEFDKPENYGCRLYLNDGKGNFSFAADAIPQWGTPSQTAVNADFDGDGDQDIFVGGSDLPGKYPNAGKSYFLRNDKGKFTIADMLPNQGNLGIINDALLMDINKDGFPDLVLAGSWQSVQVLLNQKNKFVDQTKERGFGNSDGLWYSLAAADVDKDGDLDIIAGNRGNNIPFSFSETKPGVLSYQDLDGNGAAEGMISYYFPDGKLHPKYSLDQLTTQAPGLKSKYNSYKSYSMATTQDVVGADTWNSVKKWYLKQASSVVFINNGKGAFTASALNPEAQIFPVKDIFATDLDGDGITDLVLVGNHFETSPEIGREDAGRGLVLKGIGNGKFTAISASKSGFYLPSDSRKIFVLKTGTAKKLFGVANNQGPLVFFEY